MKSKAHADAFSSVFVKSLLDLRAAIACGDKSAANIHYAHAGGLIGGAVLTGGISKRAGEDLLLNLEDVRTTFMDTFGEAPQSPTALS